MNCRVCDSTDLDLAVDLNDQPWCNHFLRKDELGTERYYPLRLLFCHRCHTPQLDYTVSKETMFGDHTYLSGVTKTLSSHFQTVAKEVDQRFFKHIEHKHVLDIGSNDGTQLQHYKSLGYEVLGIESSKGIASMANAAGIETLNDFASEQLLRGFSKKFHVINAAGVFFHLEDLHAITEGIREVLRDDGVFVIQFLYMKRIVENLAFDQIYHEHLLYYNLENLETLLNRHGLAIFDAYLSPIHGGSMMAFVSRQGTQVQSERLQALRRREEVERSNDFSTYLKFGERIDVLKTENLAYLEQAKRAGKTLYGFGAPVKGNTLLNYFQIGPDLLDYLVEKNELRRDLYSPGMHIKILLESELVDLPEIYYVLAWNFKDEILANNQSLIEQGVEFYFPINPTPVCV